MASVETDCLSKINSLISKLKARGHTLGFAESCTGGLLAHWLTQVSGVSEVFRGSVVSYATEVKADVLKVPMPIILAHGVVSPAVARYMARGASLELRSNWAVAVTGVAGPGGGSVDKPVGTVCFAAVGPGFEEALTHYFDSKLTRADIQRQAALFALDFLLDAMK